MRFQLNRCVRKNTNALSDTHTHTQPFGTISGHAELLSSLVLAWSEHNWVLGGNDRLWLHGFGSESGSEAGEWDRQQHRGYLPLESYIARLVLRRSDDVLQIKLVEPVELCTAVLDAETPFSIKNYAGY